jgi:hypothetical protein
VVLFNIGPVTVCVYYCRTFYKAVRVGDVTPNKWFIRFGHETEAALVDSTLGYVLPNLDSVNHCTSKYLFISILISLLVQWLTVVQWLMVD